MPGRQCRQCRQCRQPAPLPHRGKQRRLRPPQRPLPRWGKAASPHARSSSPSSFLHLRRKCKTSASIPPTSPSPKNRRRRQAPARGPAAVCSLSRPTRNAKKRPCPLLVGHGCVDPSQRRWPPALPALLVGLPPSTPSTAPPETQRSAHAPCSWGIGASIPSQRRWPPALPALLVGLPPSVPSTAPPETQRNAHAPCSWGMDASPPSQRRWPPALPALLVGLPPSVPSTAPPETQRSAHAPCSWGIGASIPSRRRWPPALPAAAVYPFSRPIRTETQNTHPLLVGWVFVRSEPTALAGDTVALSPIRRRRAAGRSHGRA